MYHVELRQFPHNLCRFNLTAEELRAIAEPWARGSWIELGERRWSPHQAKLTVLEGERLPPELLTMGRGWRAAQRRGEDVTARVLTAATEPVVREEEGAAEDASPAAGVLPRAPSHGEEPRGTTRLAADSLGLELLSQLGPGPSLTLAQAWRLGAARYPERPASEGLALTEAAVTSLLRARLIVLVREDEQDAVGEGERVLAGHEIEPALRAPGSWSMDGSAGVVRIRRS